MTTTSLRPSPRTTRVVTAPTSNRVPRTILWPDRSPPTVSLSQLSQILTSPIHPIHPNKHPPLISLPRRLGARTSRHTPLVSPPHPQPLLRTQLQLAIQLIAWILAMDEIAETTSHAPFAAVEPTACLAEIGDGRELAVDWPGGVPA